MTDHRKVHCTLLAVVLASTVLLGGAPALAASDGAEAHLTGTVVSVQGDTLTLRLHDGKQTKVDIAAAKAAHHTGLMPKGGAVTVYGTHGSDGVFHAQSVGHASPDSKQWSADD